MSDHLNSLESSLAGLLPRTSLNRDAILFEAGQRAAPFCWRWPLTALLFAGLSAVLGLQLLQRPEPQVIVKYLEQPVSVPAIVEPPAVEPNTPSPSTPLNGVLTRRSQILRYGLEELPTMPVAAPAGSESIEDLKWILRPTH